MANQDKEEYLIREETPAPEMEKAPGDEMSERAAAEARKPYAPKEEQMQPPRRAAQGLPQTQEPLTPPPSREQSAPKPRRRRRARSVAVSLLVAVLYVVCVLSIAFLLATFGWRWAGDLLALNKQPLTASVTIQAGESVDAVAERLHDAGLIEYPFLFRVFAGFTNKADKISSGTYELNTNMDYSALLSNISATSRTRETVTVTIPEGYTVKEVFELLESQGACTVEALEESALHDDYDYSFLEGLDRSSPYWMEGYLFPDTYQFYKDGDAKVALSKIIYNYSVKFNADMKVRAERLGYSQQEIMIIASIIEKETDGEDQKDIASVIYNRLDPNNTETLGKLQMDSTIQYALEERKEKLSEADLSIDSPYNTYRYPGLPVGNICNPGMEAIEAALYPNSTNYFYFTLGTDGVTHFFASYSDFNDFRNGLPVNEGTEEFEFDDDEELVNFDVTEQP